MYAFELQQAEDASPTRRRCSRRRGGKALAGGQSLVARDEAAARAARHARRPRRASPSCSGIRKDGDALVIGAMTRHAEVAASADVKAAIPALAALAEGIGDRQVRNLGTLGGSLANNDPAADYPGGGARRWARPSHTNKRKIAADDFFKGMYETALGRRRDHHRGELPGAEARPRT